MNNLVHIPMTPAAQRGETEKGIERSETSRWRKRWRRTEEGKIKAWGKVRDEYRGEKEGGKKEREERRKKGEMIANVCQGIT